MKEKDLAITPDELEVKRDCENCDLMRSDSCHTFYESVCQEERDFMTWQMAVNIALKAHGVTANDFPDHDLKARFLENVTAGEMADELIMSMD